MTTRALQLAGRAARDAGATTRPGLVLAASTLGLSMVLLDTTAVNVALPAIQDDLGGGPGALQWIVNAYTLVFAALLLSMGALADRLGSRRVFLGGLAVFAAGSVGAVLAPTLGLLLAAQVVLGLGAAATLPASLSLIGSAYADPGARARAVGVWASGSAAAFALGPVLGGLAIDVVDWRAVFALNVPLAAAALALGLRVAPRGDGAHRPLDAAGQLAVVVALTALTFGLISAGDHGWGSAQVLGALALAAAAAGAFVRHERRTASPMLPLALFADRGFSAAVGAGLLMNVAFYGELFFLTLFLQQGQGLSALETGLAFLPQPAMFMLVAPLTGRLVARRGPRAPLAAGAVASAAGALLLLGVDHGSGPLLTTGLLLNGIGGGLVIPAATAGAVASAPRALVGIASAAFNAARQVGGVLGVAVLGTFVVHGGFGAGMHEALAAAAILLAGVAALATLLPGRPALRAAAA